MIAHSYGYRSADRCSTTTDYQYWDDYESGTSAQITPVRYFTSLETYSHAEYYQEYIDLSERELKRLANLEACQKIFFENYFRELPLDLNFPPAFLIRRILRCNRKGIGLRIKQ